MKIFNYFNVIILFAFLFVSAGCSTVQGVGKDIQRVGGGNPDRTTTTVTTVPAETYTVEKY